MKQPAPRLFIYTTPDLSRSKNLREPLLTLTYVKRWGKITPEIIVLSFFCLLLLLLCLHPMLLFFWSYTWLWWSSSSSSSPSLRSKQHHSHQQQYQQGSKNGNVLSSVWFSYLVILGLREILLSIQTGFSLVNAAVVCDILQSISGLERSSIRAEPRQLVTFSRFCPFTLMTVMTVYRARIYPCCNSMLIALERPQSTS